MNDDRGFHGGDPVGDLDWRGPARRLGVPLGIARELYDRATRRAADPRRVAELYLADLHGAAHAHWPGAGSPPVPGRQTRVMQEAAHSERFESADRSARSARTDPASRTDPARRCGALVDADPGQGRSTRARSEPGDRASPDGTKPAAAGLSAGEGHAKASDALRRPAATALSVFDPRAQLASRIAVEPAGQSLDKHAMHEAPPQPHADLHAAADEHLHAQLPHATHAHATHAHATHAHGHAMRGSAVDTRPAEPHAPRAKVQLKKIDDWSRYVPDTVAKDPRQRARIAAQFQRKVRRDRTVARGHLSRLHAAHLERAAAMRGQKHRLHVRIAHAQRAALARVAGAEAHQAAAVQAAFAAAQGRVSGAAAAARSTVDASYAATVANIDQACHASAHELAQHRTRAIADITTAQMSEALLVASAFAEAHASVAAQAASEAALARSVGEIPLLYGGAQLAAARAAARKTAAAWAAQLPGKVEAQAQTAIFDHQPAYDALVFDLARVSAFFVKGIYALRKQTLDAAHRRALATASSARTEAIAAIDGQAAAARASLAAQVAAEAAAVHGAAAAARAGIRRTARAAQLAVTRGCHHAAAELHRGAHAIVERARDVDLPNVEVIAQASQGGRRQLGVVAASRAKELRDAVRRAVRQLGRQAAAAAVGMAAVATSGAASASSTARGAVGSLHQTADGAAQHLHQLVHPFARHARAIAQGARTLFGDIVAATRTSYGAITKAVHGMIDAAVSRIGPVCKQAIISREIPQVWNNASAAAAKAEPGWEKFLDFAVPIVVMVAIGVLTDGVGDAVIFGAEAGEAGMAAGEGEGLLGSIGRMLGKVAGKSGVPTKALQFGLKSGIDILGGGLSNAAGQLFQNGLEDNPLLQGVATAFRQGVIGSAIGDGFAFGLKLGLKVPWLSRWGVADAMARAFDDSATGFKNFLPRFVVNAGTGMLGDLWSGQWGLQNETSTLLQSIFLARAKPEGDAKG